MISQALSRSQVFFTLSYLCCETFPKSVASNIYQCSQDFPVFCENWRIAFKDLWQRWGRVQSLIWHAISLFAFRYRMQGAELEENSNQPVCVLVPFPLDKLN